MKLLEDTIEGTKEIVPGLDFNKTTKGKVFKSMTTPVGRDGAGNPVNRIVALLKSAIQL